MAFFLENFMNYKNMDELRKELDLLDNELIKLVSKRFKFIEQAAIIKDDISKIRDNERIESIIIRLRNLAEINDISPDIVEKLWRYIIELSIELETEIFNKK
jgi:isochorismate pyruvate lyase